VNWDPQAGQLPASTTINAHLKAGRYDEAIQLLRTWLQLEPDHVESLYNLGMVYSDRMQLSQAREPSGALSRTAPRGALSRAAPRHQHLKTVDRANP
jgi:Flp pilus assembly protein TadD